MGEIHAEREDKFGLTIQMCRQMCRGVTRGKPRGNHPGSGASSSGLKQALGVAFKKFRSALPRFLEGCQAQVGGYRGAALALSSVGRISMTTCARRFGGPGEQCRAIGFGPTSILYIYRLLGICHFPTSPSPLDRVLAHR